MLFHTKMVKIYTLLQTKKAQKPYPLAPHIYLYSLYKGVLPSPGANLTLFQTKMVKIYALFQTKKARKPYTLAPHIYLYSLYKGVLPSPGANLSLFQTKKAQKPYTLAPRTYLYSLCKRVSPPRCDINFLCGIKLLSFVCFPVNCFIHPNPPRPTFQVMKC